MRVTCTSDPRPYLPKYLASSIVVTGRGQLCVLGSAKLDKPAVILRNTTPDPRPTLPKYLASSIVTGRGRLCASGSPKLEPAVILRNTTPDPRP